MSFPILHLYMVTLWHPECFLGCSADDLRLLPAIKRNRAELERTRSDTAAELRQPLSYRPFHGRIVSNTGKQVNSLRHKWVDSPMIAQMLNSYEPRLIDTSETGSQARWRCEFRFSWGDAGAELPIATRVGLLKGIAGVDRLSIRQLWRNPTKARIGVLPLAIPEDGVEELGNLHIGPLDDRSKKAADVRFDLQNGAWWIAPAEPLPVSQ